jgi:hypothetical protein
MIVFIGVPRRFIDIADAIDVEQIGALTDNSSISVSL